MWEHIPIGKIKAVSILKSIATGGHNTSTLWPMELLEKKRLFQFLTYSCNGIHLSQS